MAIEIKLKVRKTVLLKALVLISKYIQSPRFYKLISDWTLVKIYIDGKVVQKFKVKDCNLDLKLEK
jgi:hypothetical protein